MNHTTLRCPLGDLTVFEDADRIISLDWGWVEKGTQNWEPTPLLREASKQLYAYFSKKLKVFDLPLNPTGTPFQKIVLKHILRIPHGKTETYGKIAKQLNTSPRAVGNACSKNPIPIIIPCHRVLGHSSLGGYSGEGGLASKSTLLCLESSVGKDGKLLTII